MEVKGARSEAILRRCHLHDGKAGGILFQDDAAGYLGECHLYQNKLSQVVIGKGCSPTLSACKISHALMAGIYVNEGGEGFIENCDIWGNAVGGVQCRRGAQAPFPPLPDFLQRTLRRARGRAERGLLRAMPDLRQRAVRA